MTNVSGGLVTGVLSKKCLFSIKQSRGKWELQLCLTPASPSSLCCAHLYRCSSGAKAIGTANSEAEPSDRVCEIVDTRFKSDARNHFGFSETGNEKGGKWMGRQKQFTLCTTD